MTRLSESLQHVNVSQILRSLEGLTMVRPMLLVGISFLAAALLAAAGASIAYTHIYLAVAVGLISICIALSGVFGAGVILMDKAREIEPRGLVDAGVFGFMCLLKAFLLGLIYLLISIAITVVAVFIFFVCRTPGVGPFIFGLTFPPIALIYGVMIFLMIVAFQLTLPALWEGRSVTGTLGVIFTMIKERLIMVVLSFLFLYFICIVVGGFVAQVLLGGIGSALGAAASVMDYQTLALDLRNLLGALMGGGTSSGGGYLIAISIDIALMGIIAIAVLSQVWMMGINLVYLAAVDGLDTAGAHRAVQNGLEKVKNKAEEIRRQAHDAAERARQAAESARARSAVAAAARTSDGPPVSGSAASHCPACRGITKITDVFCGHCGHRLS